MDWLMNGLVDGLDWLVNTFEDLGVFLEDVLGLEVSGSLIFLLLVGAIIYVAKALVRPR